MPEPRNAGPHPRGAAAAGGAAGPAVVGGGKDCLQQPWPHRGSKGPQQTAKCCPLPHVVGQAGVCSASSRKRLSRLQFCALQVIRTYSGPSAKKLFDLIEERKREVEGLIRPITGFV